MAFGTYLGGSAEDEGLAIAVDGSGNVFIAGESASSNFPGPPAPGFAGGAHDAFVTKLNSSGAVQFTTFIGGTGDDAATGVALDSSGNIFMAGNTRSGSSFPPNVAHGGLGGQDAFVAEFTSGGTLSGVAVLGGAFDDTAEGIAIDGNGNIYVAGETDSNNFPVSSAFQGAFAGGVSDAFITKLPSVTSSTLSF
ncbi:MAG: hypothetical protein DMG82_26530, partial [Acidobacteria bacterium]